ncbi:hypothetical protein C1646_822715 [Rhizophagus diaphanus]|nr:hypothetical protein C1646_822715 [Rhizophagus diaphanus] [Rhizophagus sp. MUCL 43196]
MKSCYRLEYLNISNRREYSEASICNVIRSCPRLQQLDLSFCQITNITIKEIAGSYLNLKQLGIPHDAPRDVASLKNFINDKLSRRLSECRILARPSLRSGGRLYNTQYSVDNSNISMTVDSDANHFTIAITRQVPRNYSVALLDNQAEW